MAGQAEGQGHRWAAREGQGQAGGSEWGREWACWKFRITPRQLQDKSGADCAPRTVIDNLTCQYPTGTHQFIGLFGESQAAVLSAAMSIQSRYANISEAEFHYLPVGIGN